MNGVGANNEILASAVLDELFRSGVRDVCVSPGGRSTPLVIALSRTPGWRVWIVTDERDSAFFGLGVALANRRPVAVVCTSGSAVANLLPAVVEAFWSEVPLLLLTADRPVEQRDCGAPQTIRQPDIFQGHVKWRVETPAPDAASSYETSARAIACRAAAMARMVPAGPVHVNLPFREPLVAESPYDGPSLARASSTPFCRVHSADLVAPEDAIHAFTRRLPMERGLIVCGPKIAPEARDPIAALAGSLGWPLLADPLSGMRHGSHPRTLVLDAYDILLRSPTFVAEHIPNLVLRFGALPTSKPLNRFLGDSKADHWLVTTSVPWSDPSFVVGEVVAAEASSFCERVLARIGSPAAGLSAWASSWQAADVAVRRATTEALSSQEEIFEGAVVAHLVELLPQGSLLMVGNSMPVRDLDTFGSGSAKDLRLLANRGANGIDGVVATAMGAAATTTAPAFLYIGDLSFLHDLGALQIAKRYRISLTIIVANNDGGGIFHFLPPALRGAAFESFFGTPHGLDLGPAVRMCGGEHVLVTDLAAFAVALRDRLQRPEGLHVIEVRTQRESNVARHRQVVTRALRVLAPSSNGAG